MAGNALEWTNSISRDYPYDPGDGRENLDDASARRVVRGGSWYFGQGDALAAFRNWFIPDFRGNLIGFRVYRPLSP
jgi:formylglycine-generating enzyme required for sulfatase activity